MTSLDKKSKGFPFFLFLTQKVMASHWMNFDYLKWFVHGTSCIVVCGQIYLGIMNSGWFVRSKCIWKQLTCWNNLCISSPTSSSSSPSGMFQLFSRPCLALSVENSRSGQYLASLFFSLKKYRFNAFLTCHIPKGKRDSDLQTWFRALKVKFCERISRPRWAD